MATIDIDLTELPKLSVAKFYPLYWNESRYLVLMGGGGSGKSVFAAQKVVIRMLNESNHRILVLRKVAKTLRESVYAEIRGAIGRWNLAQLFTVKKSELMIECVNGNQILFAGLDDVEKLKSISGITSIWIEEASELTPEDFRQLDIRLRGRTASYKQMIITFNPIDINHWLKKEFFDHKKPNATVLHSTYKDNPFLDDEARRVLEQFKETDPYYYDVYALGMWGVLGKTIFNAQIVNSRISELQDKKPPTRGFFVFGTKGSEIDDKTIKWIDSDDGYIAIYEDVKRRVPYVIGGDTAGDGSDMFVGQVLNNITGSQCAVLHHQFDEDHYTQQMYCLGRYYNNALIGIETNFSTYPAKQLSNMKYPKQYIREVPDTFTGKLQKRFGFNTNKLTRPFIISELVKVVRENPGLIRDIPTLNEMLTFVRNEKGRPEAKEGAHDDLIMALAIAHHIRGQQAQMLVEEENESIPTPFPFDSGDSEEGDYLVW